MVADADAKDVVGDPRVDVRADESRRQRDRLAEGAEIHLDTRPCRSSCRRDAAPWPPPPAHPPPPVVPTAPPRPGRPRLWGAPRGPPRDGRAGGRDGGDHRIGLDRAVREAASAVEQHAEPSAHGAEPFKLLVDREPRAERARRQDGRAGETQSGERALPAPDAQVRATAQKMQQAYYVRRKWCGREDSNLHGLPR